MKRRKVARGPPSTNRVKLKERCILILVEVEAWNVLKSCILYFCSHEADRLGMVEVDGVEKLTLKL